MAILRRHHNERRGRVRRAGHTPLGTFIHLERLVGVEVEREARVGEEEVQPAKVEQVVLAHLRGAMAPEPGGLMAGPRADSRRKEVHTARPQHQANTTTGQAKRHVRSRARQGRTLTSRAKTLSAPG